MELGRRKLGFWDYFLALFYAEGVVAFIAYLVHSSNSGEAIGLFRLSRSFMEQSPNGIKWFTGIFLLLFALSLGGTGMWVAALYVCVKFAEATNGHALAMISWWVVQFGGGLLQFQGYHALDRLLMALELDPYRPGKMAERSKPEGLEVANKATTAASDRRKAVTNPRAFDGLIGVDKAIQEFKDALELPIVHPELTKQYNIEPIRGIIPYGPPGTGKTSLARAVAAYFNVPFVYQKASALNIRYVGVPAAGYGHG
ncbi:MAG: AAA family ATPase [Bacillota bacterium]|jgi:hypothetical protein